MGFSREKRAFLIAHIGEARVKVLEHELEGKQKMLQELGIRWKAVAEPFDPIQPYVDDLLAGRVVRS